MKQRIDVSPEMLAFVGCGEMPRDGWPAGAFALSVSLPNALLSVSDYPADADPSADLVLVVARSACQRLFSHAIEDGHWHLPADLRGIAVALHGCALPEPARATLRLAKSIELLCAIFEAAGDGRLVRAEGASALSELDAHRIAAARRLIDEHWREKLTLDGIARACGLNRTKLTRGFRTMFACTVNDAITERRLTGAQQMLLGTDLPVSSIGYRCGYLNNASFTRAFSRRFGIAPSQSRAHRAAA